MRHWLYGLHAVRAALENPARVCRLLYHTAKYKGDILALAARRGVRTQVADTGHFARALPPGSVHQGVALETEPLSPTALEDFTALEAGVLVMLDQVTDPHNVGAILRSAAAFGAAGVIGQSRHAPEESGALAKAASGALEQVPYGFTVNISRALEELADAGFWRLGMDSAAGGDIRALPHYPKLVLVLGAEGAGLRPLVAKSCDILARLPTEAGFPSLNVSNAAAVALYHLRRVITPR